MRARYRLSCTSCGFETQEFINRCVKCGDNLEYIFDPDYLREVALTGPLTFWKYRRVLPTVVKPITLGEGGTPLQEAKRLGEALGLRHLYLKDETRNPTNSFKDRSASLVVSDAVSRGYGGVICASNGNHGASVAAYSAKANIECQILVPKDLDMGKLAQMIIYDANPEEAGSTIEEAIAKAAEIAEGTGLYQATAELNPLASEALKTISYELAEQAQTPDWIVVAMGSGATVYAIWKGYKELLERGVIDHSPRLIGVQASGCSPIVKAFMLDLQEPVRIDKPETSAVAIRVASPIYGRAALRALRESKGLALGVTDEEMLMAERELARYEGIFAEPASAATIASLHRLVDSGVMDRGDSVVTLITSSGLKTDDVIKTLNRRKRSTGLGTSLATKERILRIVKGGRIHGYELWKRLGRRMTLGAVYQHISYLERRGLIVSSTDGRRKYLEISERGIRALKALDELRILL
ncbi:threonine synthase [Candidatus Bathyarchaeota archaeon]|nr:threonine synthase [Candidatus Bathyarchaeota archaeon]